jgi:hypothetical protein
MDNFQSMKETELGIKDSFNIKLQGMKITNILTKHENKESMKCYFRSYLKLCELVFSHLCTHLIFLKN